MFRGRGDPCAPCSRGPSALIYDGGFMLPESVRAAIHWTSNAVWGPWTIFLLLGTGLFLTVRLRFVQVTRFGDALRTLIPAEKKGAGGVLTPYQAFMTALAASIGTGNIAG